MIKIVGERIIDLIPFQKGILFVLKEKTADGQNKISFYSFDMFTQTMAGVTKNAYLLTKFGPAYAAITACLDDYISCAAQKLNDGRTFVCFSNGEVGIFDERGELQHASQVRYDDAPLREAATDGSFVWCTVPDKNCVVRYNVIKQRIDMRIGDPATASVERPVSISVYDNNLFVCCRNTNTLKMIRLDDCSISDYTQFDEPVLQYLRVGSVEFAVLQSGVYLL